MGKEFHTDINFNLPKSSVLDSNRYNVRYYGHLTFAVVKHKNTGKKLPIIRFVGNVLELHPYVKELIKEYTGCKDELTLGKDIIFEYSVDKNFNLDKRYIYFDVIHLKSLDQRVSDNLVNNSNHPTELQFNYKYTSNEYRYEKLMYDLEVDCTTKLVPMGNFNHNDLNDGMLIKMADFLNGHLYRLLDGRYYFVSRGTAEAEYGRILKQIKNKIEYDLTDKLDILIAKLTYNSYLFEEVEFDIFLEQIDSILKYLNKDDYIELLDIIELYKLQFNITDDVNKGELEKLVKKLKVISKKYENVFAKPSINRTSNKFYLAFSHKNTDIMEYKDDIERLINLESNISEINSLIYMGIRYDSFGLIFDDDKLSNVVDYTINSIRSSGKKVRLDEKYMIVPNNFAEVMGL